MFSWRATTRTPPHPSTPRLRTHPTLLNTPKNPECRLKPECRPKLLPEIPTTIQAVKTPKLYRNPTHPIYQTPGRHAPNLSKSPPKHLLCPYYTLLISTHSYYLDYEPRCKPLWPSVISTLHLGFLSSDLISQRRFSFPNF